MRSSALIERDRLRERESERERVGGRGRGSVPRIYLTQSVSKVVLQKSIPTRIRHLVPHVSNSQGYVDGFVGDLTSEKDIKNTPRKEYGTCKARKQHLDSLEDVLEVRESGRTRHEREKERKREREKEIETEIERARLA